MMTTPRTTPRTVEEYKERLNKSVRKYRDKKKQEGIGFFSVYLHQTDIDFIRKSKEQLGITAGEVLTKIIHHYRESISQPSTSVSDTELISLINDLKSEGSTRKQIVEIINKKGFKTKTGKQFSCTTLDNFTNKMKQ